MGRQAIAALEQIEQETQLTREAHCDVHTFRIAWETFQDDLHRSPGFVDFLIVDDYYAPRLWDELLTGGISKVGIRPEGFAAVGSPSAASLPGGRWRMLHAVYAFASDELFARAGVSKPALRQLPAVYCMVHGEVTGECMFKVDLDSAVEFIKQRVVKTRE